MKKINISIPFNMKEEEVKLFLYIKLFEENKLTLGQAAKLSGYSKKAFIEIVSKHGIPVINYSPEELQKDIQNA